jgi:hypothetical protein
VQKLLGHSTITTTERYLHASDDSTRGAVERLAQHRTNAGTAATQRLTVVSGGGASS